MKKVGLIAVISIIFVVLFPNINAKVSCYTGFSINIFDYVLETGSNFEDSCKPEPVTETTPPPIVVEDPPPEDPPEGYLPISYYNKADVSLLCTPSNSYYTFSIPESAVPYAVGTKTITITNNKDWDMWMKISSVQTYNHLKVTAHPTDYKTFSNGSTISFKVSWSWTPPDGYEGKKGGASIFFNTACSEPIAAPPAPTPAPTQPKPPTPYIPSLTVEERSDTSIRLSWNNALYAESYELKMIQNPNVNSVIYSGSATSFQANNLISGTSYQFQIRAKNSVGYSNWQTITVQTTGSSQLPGKATTLRVVSTTQTTISLEWSSVGNATTYALYRNDALIYQGSSTSYTDNNLRTGTTYTYKLHPKNSYGTGESVTVQGKTTGAELLPKTPNLYSKDVTQTSATLYWDNAENATTYELSNGDKSPYKGSGTSYTVTGLIPGKTYKFWVRSFNQYGESAWKEHSLTTKEYRFDDEIDLTEQCTPRVIEKRLFLPDNIRRGDNGRFEIFVENKSNKEIQVDFSELSLNGVLFSNMNNSVSPMSVSADRSTRTIPADSSIIVTVNWEFLKSGDKIYEGKSGYIEVKLATKCQ